jgi:transcriptional regulator with XRE-family HTH domain
MKFKFDLKLDIGVTLRKYRDINKFSQQFVSNYLNISRNAYRKWENNAVDFSISQLEKIADLYQIPLHIIISESYTH